MPIVTSNDYIPQLEAAGLSATIESLTGQMLDLFEFVRQLNSAIKPMPGINDVMLLQYIADAKAAGRLSPMVTVTDVVMPQTITRPGAPDGFGQDANGIWFSTPKSGNADILWYRNGTLALHQKGVNLAQARSVDKSGLACSAGDTVQVAIYTDGVVGWFGRMSIT
jgi:hypothetical protein